MSIHKTPLSTTPLAHHIRRSPSRFFHRMCPHRTRRRGVARQRKRVCLEQCPGGDDAQGLHRAHRVLRLIIIVGALATQLVHFREEPLGI